MPALARSLSRTLVLALSLVPQPVGGLPAAVAVRSSLSHRTKSFGPMPLPPPLPIMTPLPELSMALAEETATKPPVARVANAASDAIPFFSQEGFSLGGVGLLCSLCFSISLLNRTILIKQRRAPTEPNRRRTTCLPQSGQSRHEHYPHHEHYPRHLRDKRQHASMRTCVKT